MSWSTLEPEIQRIAARVLTDRQLATWVLWIGGVSQRRIAVMDGVTRSTVRSHLEDAHARLLAAGVLRSPDGSYYLEEVTAA